MTLIDFFLLLNDCRALKKDDAAEDAQKGRVTGVELFYTDGDICDITGKPREVIVRLKVSYTIIVILKNYSFC